MQASEQEDILQDKVLRENANKVLNVLSELKNKEVNPVMIEQVLKVQQLAKELSDNGN